MSQEELRAALAALWAPIVWTALGAGIIALLALQLENYWEYKPTLLDILIWADNPTLSATQLQKSYDWTIAQWSAFATAILTAVLGFISAVIVDMLKGPSVSVSATSGTSTTGASPSTATGGTSSVTAAGLSRGVIIAGVLAFVALYAFDQFQISRLNAQFIELFSLFALLHSG